MTLLKNKQALSPARGSEVRWRVFDHIIISTLENCSGQQRIKPRVNQHKGLEMKLQLSRMFKHPKTEAQSLSGLLISCSTFDRAARGLQVEKNDPSSNCFSQMGLCFLSWLYQQC